ENKQQNNDIPTDAYITVKRDEKGEVEIYVGGKPATKYRGQNIWDVPYIKECFEWMQAQNPDIEEFHIGAFETLGEFARSGNPSSGFGPHTWCRLKFKNGKCGAWVFSITGISAADCALSCADDCAHDVRNYSGFRAAVFNAPIAKTVENPTVEIDGKGLAQFIVNSVYGKQK
ncbi:MAG: hypothetical protein KBT14_02785, partial [Proteobacteria bacterium]|nr:hypothetical protein [Candidatus Enterousia onthequi]